MKRRNHVNGLLLLSCVSTQCDLSVRTTKNELGMQHLQGMMQNKRQFPFVAFQCSNVSQVLTQWLNSQIIIAEISVTSDIPACTREGLNKIQNKIVDLIGFFVRSCRCCVIRFSQKRATTDEITVFSVCTPSYNLTVFARLCRIVRSVSWSTPGADQLFVDNDGITRLEKWCQRSLKSSHISRKAAQVSDSYIWERVVESSNRIHRDQIL